MLLVQPKGVLEEPHAEIDWYVVSRRDLNGGEGGGVAAWSDIM